MSCTVCAIKTNQAIFNPKVQKRTQPSLMYRSVPECCGFVVLGNLRLVVPVQPEAGQSCLSMTYKNALKARLMARVNQDGTAHRGQM